ncbi:MAG: hypothetical protein ACRCRW_15795 [Aeromonadaceae bacterium]
MKQPKSTPLARQAGKREEERQRQQQLHRLLLEAKPQFIRLIQYWLEQDKPKGDATNPKNQNRG